MQVGPAFAYGTQGLPPTVPGMSPLIFQIELICFCDAEVRSHIPEALKKTAKSKAMEEGTIAERMQLAHNAREGPKATVIKDDA